MSSKVPAALVHALVRHRPEGARPRARHGREFFGEVGEAELDVRDPLPGTVAVEADVGDFVVDAHAGRRAGGGEVVEGDPG